MSSKSTLEGIRAKKEWLSYRIDEGLMFEKLDARGKVFIEYLPAENAWVPIEADGYMYINCFWVSGSFKGKGYGKQLLQECEKDANDRGYKGVILTVGNKKKSFLSDRAFMIRNGYEVADTCEPYFELLVKRFDQSSEMPRYKACARQGLGEGIKGIDFISRRSAHSPFPILRYCSQLFWKDPIRISQIKSKKEAQNHVSLVTTYSVFVDGKFFTQEIYTADKLRKLVEKQAK